jgi:hypothetical protein
MIESPNSAKRLLLATVRPIMTSPLAMALPGVLAAASLGGVGASVAQLLPLFQQNPTDE